MAGRGAGVEGAILNVVAGIVLADDFSSKLSNSVDDAVGPAAEKAGKTFGEKIGKSFEQVGKDLSLKVTAPLVAAGTAAVASFISVDEGLDKVRIQTGATGEELAGLETAVKNVATSSSLGFGDAADVISTLNSRLELTGKPLEALATQIANVGELTGKSLDPVAVADFFSAFDIPVDKQTEQLDTLFVIAQKTGVPFEQLIGTLEQNAAKFQQLGFTAEEAAVLLAQTEKAGFSADGVLAGLTKSIIKSTGSNKDLLKAQEKLVDLESSRTDTVGKLTVANQKLQEVLADPKAKESTVLAAKEAVASLERDLATTETKIKNVNEEISNTFKATGKTGKDAFDSVIAEIQRLVAAGDEAGASALAKDTFGKGFIEVLQAAEAGAFDYKALNSELENTAGTINNLTAETADFPKSLDIAKKSLATALEPVGGEIGLIIQQFTKELIPIIQELGDAFTSLSPEARKTIVVIGGIVAALGPVISTLAKVSQIVTGLGPLFAKVGTALMANPWLLALAAVVAIGVVIYKNWDKIAAFFSALWESLKEGVSSVFSAIGDFFVALYDGIKSIVSGIGNFLSSAFTAFVDGIKAIWGGLVNIVKGILDAVKNVIVGYFTIIYVKPITFFVEALQKIWGSLTGVVSKVFNIIADVIKKAVSLYIGYAKFIFTGFSLVWDGIKNAAVKAFDFVLGVIRRVKETIDSIVRGILNIPGTIGGALGNIPLVGGLFKAEGGPVKGNQPYIVGEVGPELFVPRTSGTIIPNNQLAQVGSGPGYTINVYNPVAEPASTSIPDALRRATYLRG